eukprot:6174079-Pleurochrysis_carterae.AAC.2
MAVAERSPLLTFLKAPSKRAVSSFCSEAFCLRDSSRDDPARQRLLLSTSLAFGVSVEEVDALLLAVVVLAKDAVKLTGAQELTCLFPANFHADLAALLARIVDQQSAGWRAELQATMVSSMPGLHGVNCHVYRTPPGNKGESTSNVLLNLDLSQDGFASSSSGACGPMHVVMKPEQLNSFIDSLHMIKRKLEQMRAQPAICTSDIEDSGTEMFIIRRKGHSLYVPACRMSIQERKAVMVCNVFKETLRSARAKVARNANSDMLSAYSLQRTTC